MNAIKIDEKYTNQNHIKMKLNTKKTKGMIKDYISKKNTIPPFEIKRKKIEKEFFNSKDSLIWLGHSTILGRINNLTFIVDPMLGNRASPLKYLGPKRFEGSSTPLEELPDIDIILITHNHYDHLDKETILALKDKVQAIYLPLDNKKILSKWGIDSKKMKEFDWYEDFVFQDVQFSFCPTQHFSGRSLTDRDKSLWGSWAVISDKKKIYLSGDSGYNEHFKQIKQRYGSFDISCIECGAYNDNWSEIHMTPEESVQASVDLESKAFLPMHWAGFDLSTHAWDEPITRALKKSEELKANIITPMIGEVIDLNILNEFKQWWR